MPTQIQTWPDFFGVLVQSNSFWTIVGVLLGTFLGEGIRWVRKKKRRRDLKAIVREELNCIKQQILQKNHMIAEIITALNKREILSGDSVPIMDTAYRRHIGELYEHLTLKQRNCLHVIHERLRSADELLSSFEPRISDEVLRLGASVQPYVKYKTLFKDHQESYDVVTKLIDSYLANEPEDVFYVGPTHHS